MDKYITTSEHPFGAGHIIELRHGEWFLITNEPFMYSISGEHLKNMIANERAKELALPKWTDEDMKNAIYETIKYMNNSYDCGSPISVTGDFLFNELHHIITKDIMEEHEKE